MRCIILRFFVPCLFVFSAFGQENYIPAKFLSDSLTRNRLAMDLTIAYFEDYFNVNGGGKRNEKIGAQNFQTYRYDSTEFVKDTSQIIDFLEKKENGWRGSGPKVFRAYKSDLDSLIESSKDSLIYLKNLYRPDKVLFQGRRTAIWNSWVEKNKGNPVAFVQKNGDISVGNDIADLILKKVQEPDYGWIILLLFTVNIGTLLFLLKLHVRLKKSLKEQKEGTSNRKKTTSNQVAHVENFKDDIDRLKKTLETSLSAVKADLQNLHQRFNQMERQFTSLQKEPNLLASKKEQAAKKTIPAVSTENIYLPPPFDTDTFHATDAGKMATDRTFYRIEREIGNGTGKLFLHENALLLQAAFEEPEKFIYRACEIENALNDKHHTKIKVLKPGRVELEGELWVVKEKIKIQFT